MVIPAERARSILGEMGIHVPPNMRLGDLNQALELTPKLTPEQIQNFVDKAGSCG